MKFEQLEISQFDKFQQTTMKFKSSRFQRKSCCEEPPQFYGKIGNSNGCEEAQRMSWEEATSPLELGEPLPPVYKASDDYEPFKPLESDPRYTNPLFGQQVSIINREMEFLRLDDNGGAEVGFLDGTIHSTSELWTFEATHDEMVWFIKNAKTLKYLSATPDTNNP